MPIFVAQILALSSILGMSEPDRGVVAWAEEVFGLARLGDVRRTKRLVSMAAAAGARPHVHINEVFVEGMNVAYDFVENDRVSPGAMVDAMCEATARSASQLSRVFVATDGSSVAITDNDDSKESGRVGSDANGGKGDKTHAALAIGERGEAVGIIDLQFWRRTGPSKKAERAKLTVDQKETQRWLDARANVRRRMAEHAAETRIHFLHDREADSWTILQDAFEHRETEDTTIRASWNRRIVPENEGDDETRFVRDAVDAAPLKGSYELNVAAGPNRTARTAKMEVRAAEVTLRLRDQRNGEIRLVKFTAVHAREAGTQPKNDKPIDWLLYTTQNVNTFEEALSIVRAYAYRWRIEEFHRAWKRGGTDAEHTQLVGNNRTRWLIILAAVAVRAVRLNYLARIDPDRDPLREFDEAEVNAVRAVLARRKRTENNALTLSFMVNTIAKLGGYVQQKSNPAPGTQTLVRGLKRLADLVLGAKIAIKEPDE